MLIVMHVYIYIYIYICGVLSFGAEVKGPQSLSAGSTADPSGDQLRPQDLLLLLIE